MSRVLGARAERISAGSSAPLRRETTSCVYHVVAGHGHSVIGEKEYAWETGDVFCIPAWYRYQHFASSEEMVYLFRFDDRPMLDALGFYRSDGMDTETLVFD